MPVHTYIKERAHMYGTHAHTNTRTQTRHTHTHTHNTRAQAQAHKQTHAHTHTRSRISEYLTGGRIITVRKKKVETKLNYIFGKAEAKRAHSSIDS